MSHPASGPRSDSPRRFRARPAALAAVAACTALAACKSYEPAPLDRDAHRAAWHGRALDDDALRAFAEDLASARGDADTFDPSDGLTLREGRVVALFHAPALRLARLRVERAAASAEHAGAWRDPEFGFDVRRVTESVPDPWIVSAGLAFTLPLSGGPAAERDLADAEQGVAVAAALAAEWDARRDLDAAWIAWSAARLRAQETERFVAELDGLAADAARLAERGELPRTEATLFAVERAQQANALRRLRGETTAAELRVRARLGLAPDAPVALVPTLAAPGGPPAVTDAGARIEARQPDLERRRREYAAAEDRLRREVRRQYPDLVLGPLVESDEGQSRVGLVGGLPIPLWNANRRAIAEAEVDRLLARAAVEAEYEALVGRHAQAAARAAALADQRADLESAVAPLVDRQVADALALLRLGEGSSLVLLESLVRAHATKLALVDARAEEQRALAEVTHLLGPDAPPTVEETPDR